MEASRPSFKAIRGLKFLLHKKKFSPVKLLIIPIIKGKNRINPAAAQFYRVRMFATEARRHCAK